MDERRFDTLAKSLFARRTRRGAMRSLAAGGVTTGLAAFGLGDSAAACKQQGFRCKRQRDCCTEVCKRIGGKKKCWCKSLGDTCEKAENCCSLPAGMECATVGPRAGASCLDGARCCLAFASPCQADCECCKPFKCGELTGECCLPNLENCGVGVECCSGLCDNGICRQSFS